MAKETAEAPPTDDNKDTEQPGGDTAPMAVQPVHGAPMAGQPVLATPEEEVAAKSVDNPALAGLPPKPRCGQCASLLADGRCVYPECSKEQDGVAQ